MYSIAEWQTRYEVSIKGREPKDGEQLRVGPLLYVRLRVHGHQQGLGYRKLQVISGKRFMEVFGIFCKFLEISGNQIRERRGNLLNEKDEPATAEDLAFIISCSLKQTEAALSDLCKLGWLINSIKPNITQHNTTQASRNFPENPEKPPNPHSLTPKKDKYGEFVFLTKKEYTKLLNRFGTEQQLREKIDELNEGIGSKGYKYKSHYHTILAWHRRKGKEVGSKTKLYPLKAKICGMKDCVRPAVYKNSKGAYDSYCCDQHLPTDVAKDFY